MATSEMNNLERIFSKRITEALECFSSTAKEKAEEYVIIRGRENLLRATYLDHEAYNFLFLSKEKRLKFLQNLPLLRQAEIYKHICLLGWLPQQIFLCADRIATGALADDIVAVAIAETREFAAAAILKR